MSDADPTVQISVTIPSSLFADLEAAIAAGEVANRSQGVTQALRLLITAIHEKQLRSAVLRLSDKDSPDKDYKALRRRP